MITVFCAGRFKKSRAAITVFLMERDGEEIEASATKFAANRGLSEQWLDVHAVIVALESVVGLGLHREEAAIKTDSAHLVDLMSGVAGTMRPAVRGAMVRLATIVATNFARARFEFTGVLHPRLNEMLEQHGFPAGREVA